MNGSPVLLDRALQVVLGARVGVLLVERVEHARTDLQALRKLLREQRQVRDQEVVHIGAVERLHATVVLELDSARQPRLEQRNADVQLTYVAR